MLTKISSLKTTFSGVDFSKYSSKTSEFVKEFSSRANKEGKFLNWVNLPQEQAKRLDDIYALASKLKSQTLFKYDIKIIPCITNTILLSVLSNTLFKKLLNLLSTSFNDSPLANFKSLLSNEFLEKSNGKSDIFC